MLVLGLQYISSPKNAQGLVVKIAFRQKGRTARPNRCGYFGLGFANGNGIYHNRSSSLSIGIHKPIGETITH
jgi:hypothetical protein